MLGSIFGGFTKEIERSLKNSSEYFAKTNRKELSELFDKKLFPLADRLDYIARRRVEQALNCKALMLKGRDDYHWMRYCKLDSVNHHSFQVWRSDNDTWQDDIKVKAAIFLQARDDYHWMRYQYNKDGKYDTFNIWKGDRTWHKCLRVSTAGRLKS